MRSRKQNFFLILTLGILNALSPFSIDMYLPSFQEIARDLNVSSARVALTVSSYFIGFAIGQLLYGPLLDRFGRKPPVCFGLALYVLASLGCMQAHSIEALLFFRFLSAVGGCSASVAAVAMVRDFFPPAAATKIFSSLMLVLSVSPLLAPSVGSLLLLVSGWRAIFAILALMGLVNILLVVTLPHGQLPDLSVQLDWRSIARNFRDVFAIRQFSTYTFAGAFSFTGLFVYVAGSPSIFMDYFHVSASLYGAIFALLAVGMIGGGQLNHLFARHHHAREVFRASTLVQVVLATAFFICTWFDICGLVATLIFLFLILLSAGISYPNAAGLALEPLTKNIGSASALLGFVQLGIGAATSSAVGLLKVEGSLPTAATMCLSALAALFILLIAKDRNGKVQYGKS